MKISLYISMLLALCVCCKVKEQKKSYQQQNVQKEQMALDSLCSKQFSHTLLKRDIQTRLFTFMPPDSLGNQAIHTLVEMKIIEKENKQDSVYTRRINLSEEVVEKKATTIETKEKNVSWIFEKRIIGIFIFIVCVILFFLCRRYFMEKN